MKTNNCIIEPFLIELHAKENILQIIIHINKLNFLVCWKDYIPRDAE